MIDLIHDEDFSFWLPMELEKAAKYQKDKGRRLIKGIASTKDIDLQKETVDQRGIDFSYFMKYGYYNNDHKPGFENKVGQPIECRVTPEGLWTRGFLFREHKIANAIWELANALEASRADRRLGFSIQGKVLRRAGRQILRCWVQDVAITTAPINTNTWLDVVKSISLVPEEMWCTDDGECFISPRLVSPIAKSTCNTCVKDISKKAIIGGFAIDEEEMDLKKECGRGEEEDKGKALTCASPVARVQSLEGKMTDLGWARKEHTNKSLDFNECIDILCEHRQLSRPNARVVAEAVFEMNGLFTNQGGS